MRIDTKELGKTINDVYVGFTFQIEDLGVFNYAMEELDRLYALEDATTPSKTSKFYGDTYFHFCRFKGSTTEEAAISTQCLIDEQHRVIEVLQKHLDATTPFKDRAELETYLKGKGFVKNDPDEFQIPEESEDVEPVMVSFIGGDVVAFDSGACNTKNFTLHLTLLTPALLDSLIGSVR